jgi:hypothetical protein
MLSHRHAAASGPGRPRTTPGLTLPPAGRTLAGKEEP